MPRGDTFEVVWCPDDADLRPTRPAYPAGDTLFTKIHLSGLLKDGIAPPGMVVRDTGGRLWVVFPYTYKGGEDEPTQRELVLVSVEPCGEGYCIQSPQMVRRTDARGVTLYPPIEKDIC